jgi:hypothetical protein
MTSIAEANSLGILRPLHDAFFSNSFALALDKWALQWNSIPIRDNTLQYVSVTFKQGG